MPRRKADKGKGEKKIRPALTPDAREKQMISLAVDLAEKQLLEGTASAQVITHFLKLGSVREQLERERMEKENALLDAKTKSYQSAEELKALYENALQAMKSYGGGENEEDSGDGE